MIVVKFHQIKRPLMKQLRPISVPGFKALECCGPLLNVLVVEPDESNERVVQMLA